MEKVDQVQASKAVLIEVMNVLGLYRDHLILIGGWVPELLLPNCGHIGSVDVDLAVDVRSISRRQYDTILQRLLKAGYTRDFGCFVRSVPGALEPVKLDLITGQYVEEGAGDAPARLQEIGLGKLRGVDLAFEQFSEVSLNGKMPGGAKNTVKIRIVRMEAFIVMKALAMADRLKPKDAYDICFCLKHFLPGVAELARLYLPISGHGLVREGIAVLQDKFGSADSVGPKWAAQIAEENGADREIAQREAFELMHFFLTAVASQKAGEA